MLMIQKNNKNIDILEILEKKEHKIEFKYIPEGRYYELFHRIHKEVYKVSLYKNREVPFFLENPIVWKLHLTN